MWESLVRRLRARLPWNERPWTGATDPVEVRRLPAGLRLCGDCGTIRGTETVTEAVSACYCSGLKCTWCGTIRRRPISDYYDADDGNWWHVPYFPPRHTCERPAGTPPGPRWEQLHGDPDVDAAQRRVTERTSTEVAARQQAAGAEQPRRSRGDDEAASFEERGATLSFSAVRPPSVRGPEQD